MNLWFDLKYAWRLLFKTPGYTLLSIVVVALSVGLATWSYELAYSQAYKPVGFPDSDRWYSLQVAPSAGARPKPSMDAYTYQEILKLNRSADFIGAFSEQTAVLSEGEASVSVRASAISPKLLAAMQVPPLHGRLLGDADAQSGAPNVAILAYDTWQSYFAGDTAIVGKLARIDGAPVQIVGVMPEDDTFYSFQDFEIWRPLHLPQMAQPEDSNIMLSPIIKLHDGQNVESVLNEARSAIAEVDRSHPRLFDAGRAPALIPAHRMWTHQLMTMVATVSFTSLAVLLLGGVNISLIFFARQLERSRELALRTALGSSRARLLRQCLTETALVVLAGMLAGIGLAVAGLRWAHSLGEFSARVQASGRVLNVPMLRAGDLFAAISTAIGIWLLSTLIPAWRVAGQDAASVVAGGSKGIAVNGGGRSAGILVSLQVLVSCLVLVICAGIVVAARDEAGRPSGIDTTDVMLSTYPTVLEKRYPEAAGRLRYWDDLSKEIKDRIPAAEVAYSTSVPTRPISVPAAFENQEGSAGQGQLTLPLAAVSEDYFRVLGIRLLAGRFFDSTDNSSSLRVAILDENTAKRHFPAGNALGNRIQLDPLGNPEWVTIVGIVSPVRRLWDRERGVVYRPLRQAPPESFHLIVKAPALSAQSRSKLQAAAFAVDRDLPLHNLQMLGLYMEALNLNAASLIPSFSAIATITLFLAAAGLYGLISRSVAARTQEVGVRRAMGSTQWQVIALFMRQCARYASAGLVGVAVGVLLANMISASIPNIMSGLGAVTAGVVALMALVVFLSSYFPARRAVALEPGDALHYE